MWVAGGPGGKAPTSQGYERGDWAALPEIPGPAWLPQSPGLAGNLPFLSRSRPSGALCASGALTALTHSPPGLGSQRTRSCPSGPTPSFLLFCQVQRKMVDSLGFESQLWTFLTEVWGKAI